MKPYPNREQTEEQQFFNYRLSRARRVSENAFGLLASRFCVFHSTFNVRPESAISIAHATLVLHNFLLKQCPSYMTSVDDAVDDYICLVTWRTQQFQVVIIQSMQLKSETHYQNT